MARTETLRLILSADGKILGGELDKAQRRVQTFGQKAERVFMGMEKRILSPFTKMLKNPLALAGGAAGLAIAGKQIVDFDDKVYRLAIQAGISAKEQMKLRQEIIDTAIVSAQSRGDIAAGLDAIVQRTGDLAFAREIMGDLAIASTATGAPMADLGALATNLKEKLKLANGEIKGALNLLTVQGKAGAFTLQDMAAQGERLFSAAGRFDVRGMGELRKLGAIIQIARMGTGSSEQATTAIENALADIIDKQKEIKKNAGGFSIFKDGTKELKDIDVVMKGIISGTGGDITKLQNIFGRESIRGISTLAQMYKETGGFDLFEKLANADAGRASEIMNDFNRYSTSASFQVRTLGNVMTEFADTALAPRIGELADYFRQLTSDPERLQQFRQDVLEIAGSLSELLRVATLLTKLGGTVAGGVMDFLPGVTSSSEQRYKQGQAALKTYSKEDQAAIRQLRNQMDNRPWWSMAAPVGYQDAIDRFEANRARPRSTYDQFLSGLPNYRAGSGDGVQPPANQTTVIVNVPKTGPVTADTRSTAGTSKTVINNRGVFD